MTDSYLMGADCVHGVPWYECKECPEYHGALDINVLEAAWEEAQKQTADMVFNYDVALMIFARTVLRLMKEAKGE